MMCIFYILLSLGTIMSIVAGSYKLFKFLDKPLNCPNATINDIRETGEWPQEKRWIQWKRKLLVKLSTRFTRKGRKGVRNAISTTSNTNSN